MKVITLDSARWEEVELHGLSREAIHAHLEQSANEASQLLPSDFTFLNILVSPTSAEYVIPETGDVGFTTSEEYCSLTFDSQIPYGEANLMRSLRGSVFHEMVHATTFAHDPWRPGVMFGAVTEGVATVFERDFTDKDVLWGKYEAQKIMETWFVEIKNIDNSNDDGKNTDYFFNHPDGRRWITYKTGTWMIDALTKSGEDLFELMQLPHDQVIKKFEELA